MLRVRFLVSLVLFGGLVFGGAVFKVNAQTVGDDSSQITSLLEQVQVLIQRVKVLQDQIDELSRKQAAARQELAQTLRLTRSLSRGMTGEEIRLLQEILATDPEIYPEGLVTGYYGPLTERAVAKFQKKAGILQVGVVGPLTRGKINDLLAEGAGSSGKVPPGLLVAPGIRKKLGEAPTVPEGQRLPPGIAKKLGVGTTTPPDDEEDGDNTPPVISSVFATSTTATSSEVQWTTDEAASSKVWYSTTTPVNTGGTISALSAVVLSDPALVTSHMLMLTDLTASTTYYYVVGSTDEAGNEAISSELSFITLEELNSE